jgi:hypothetical protein
MHEVIFQFNLKNISLIIELGQNYLHLNYSLYVRIIGTLLVYARILVQ